MILKSQIVTSSWGETRKLPYSFTEQVLYMLTTVLRRRICNYIILMSEKTTSSWGGTRKLPYAFTEQGIYMLMTVLKGELATK